MYLIISHNSILIFKQLIIRWNGWSFPVISFHYQIVFRLTVLDIKNRCQLSAVDDVYILFALIFGIGGKAYSFYWLSNRLAFRCGSCVYTVVAWHFHRCVALIKNWSKIIRCHQCLRFLTVFLSKGSVFAEQLVFHLNHLGPFPLLNRSSFFIRSSLVLRYLDFHWRSHFWGLDILTAVTRKIIISVHSARHLKWCFVINGVNCRRVIQTLRPGGLRFLFHLHLPRNQSQFFLGLHDVRQNWFDCLILRFHQFNWLNEIVLLTAIVIFLDAGYQIGLIGLQPPVTRLVLCLLTAHAVFESILSVSIQWGSVFEA